MSSRPPIPPLTDRVPIVNPDGTPSQYFIRYLQERGFDIDGKVTEQTVEKMIDDSLTEHTITAGVGLAGGGSLISDPTLSLDAMLGQLNDVDLSTTPPTDGQVIVWNAASSLWLPADQSGGGGGGSSWELIEHREITVAGSTFDFTDLGDYSELLLVCRQLTSSISTAIGARLSTDNGATFYATSGDYRFVGDQTGVESNSGGISVTTAASSSAKSGVITISGNLGEGNPPVCRTVTPSSPVNPGAVRLFVASTDVVNALQVYANGGGNFTGGDIFLLGMKKSSGGGGAMELIQTVTLDADTASVSFNGIPDDYTHLKLLMTARTTASSTSSSIRVGSNIAANVDVQYIYSYGSGSVGGAQSFNSSSMSFDSTAASTPAGAFAAWEITFFDYKNPNVRKTIKGEGNSMKNATSNQFTHLTRDYVIRSTDPITDLTFTPASGDLTAGCTFSLYGLK